MESLLQLVPSPDLKKGSPEIWVGLTKTFHIIGYSMPSSVDTGSLKTISSSRIIDTICMAIEVLGYH